jgi:hypothetical protein
MPSFSFLNCMRLFRHAIASVSLSPFVTLSSENTREVFELNTKHGVARGRLYSGMHHPSRRRYLRCTSERCAAGIIMHI